MGEPQSSESLLLLFEDLEDPRVERTKTYPLEEIHFLVLAATIHGVNHIKVMEKFGNAKLGGFRSIMPYVRGIPSHHTIGRVLGPLDPDALEKMFLQPMETVARSVEGVGSIDGNAVRRAIAEGEKRSRVHMD